MKKFLFPKLIFVFCNLSFLIFFGCSDSENKQTTLLSSPFLDSLTNSKEKVNLIIDSLRTELRKADNDTHRICLLNELAEEYVKIKPEITIRIVRQTLQISQQTKFSYGTAEAWNNEGWYYLNTNKYDSALVCYNRCLEFVKSKNHTGLENLLDLAEAKATNGTGNVYRLTGHPGKAIECSNKGLKLYQDIKSNNTVIIKKAQKGIAACYNNIGAVHSDQGAYDKAIEYYEKSLKIFEEIGNKQGISYCYGNIGNVHYNQGNYDLALEYHQKNLKIAQEIGNKQGMSYCYNNIGSVYSDQGAYDKAIEYFQKSIKIKEELGDKQGMSYCYGNIGIIHFDQGAYDKAIEYHQKSLKIKEELWDKQGMSNSYNSIGNVYSGQGAYDKAIEYYQKSLKIKEELGDKQGMSNCFNNIGQVHSDQGAFDKAIEYFQKSLKIAEELGNKQGLSKSYSNIGLVHFFQGAYDKALEYYQKSLKIAEELGDKKGMSYCYINIGLVHREQGAYDKAVEYYQKSLKILEELGDKRGMWSCYGSFGVVYQDQGAYNKAIEYYKKSLKIAEELGNKGGIAITILNIANLNITLADSTAKSPKEKEDYYQQTIKYGLQTIKLAKEIKAMLTENICAGILQKAYKALGNPGKSLEYAEIFIATKDSLFKEEKTKAITEMEAKYQAEKKQLEIEKMQKQKELDNKTMEAQTAKNRKQQIIIFSAIGGFLIVLIFSIIMLRMFRQKRKANILLATQNTKIRLQKEEISAQRDEITAQRDTVVRQKDHIEEQKKEITDSINYAKRIQQAMLPDLNRVLGLQSPAGSLQIEQAIADCGLKTADYFVLYKPKDIVSGDFYWATLVNEWLIVTVADCTGHGVPGAFMSMLGVSFLNEIVRKKEVTKASEVLDYLRASVIEALQQKGQTGEQKDGMDIALCAINVNTKLMQFAGANNPLYIVRSPQSAVGNMDDNCGLQTADCRLIELKADPQPVAIHIRMKSFTYNEIQLSKGDCIYLASDGFHDQFGGQKNKKYMAKQLKELFGNIAEKPMNEQLEILDNAFENWKGENEQIDDVTILGIRI